MKILTNALPLVAGAAALSAPAVARADDPPGPHSYAWHDSQLRSGYGIAVLVGGGVTGFTDRAMRNTMQNPADGLWDIHLTLGSHIPLAFEAGYIGTAGRINSLTTTQFGTLVGTTVEGAVRWNVLPHNSFDPFLFVGVGWQRYDVTNAQFRLSDQGIRDSDNMITYPMGGGVQWRDSSGLVIDVRGTYRPTSDYGLVSERSTTQSFVPMHSWAASLSGGYEF